jgi:iron complex outermembrane receptor protein
MPRASRVLVASIAASLALFPARAAERRRFIVPAGSLSAAVLAVGRQGDVDIGLANPSFAGRNTSGLNGRMAAGEALRRLLQGTGLTAREMRPGSFLIVSTPTVAPTPRSRPVPTVTDIPIVVVASKRGLWLSTYPGSVVVVSLGTGRAAEDGRDRSLADLVTRLPMLQSTAFGSGRDKLFVRGVADSSFAGPTQSTVGTYFGETRLVYSGADPDLRLIDMERVEILEGPQGTLYGAGAIGGIFRLTPRAPDACAFAGALAIGGSATQGGKAGDDISAMVNLPLLKDRIAIRAVGYHSEEGGYIDDPQRGRDAINGLTTSGGRLAVRIVPDAAWTIDIGGLGQRIRSDGPQYAVRGLAGLLAHDSGFDQPYRDRILLGSLTATRQIGETTHLLLTTGAVDRRSHLRYDASRPGSPSSAYDENDKIHLFTGEARLWNARPSGNGWLIGVAAVQNRDTARRALGNPDAPRDISGVDNRTLDLALFGEATQAIGQRISITAGGRLTHARMDGEPLAINPPSRFIRGQSRTRADPTAGFTVKLVRHLVWFGRNGQGFRTGGLAVAAGVGRVATYRPDDIRVMESGLRVDGLFDRTVSGTIAVSQARWKNIQADLIGLNGFPFTANVGDGRVTAIEANLDWEPVPRVALTMRGLFARSTLDRPAPGFLRAGGDTLPDTPRFSGSATLRWAPPIDATQRFKIALSVRRQGCSRLGVGPILGLDQAGYTMGDIDASLVRGAMTIGIRIDNFANARGDRFAIGDPFRLTRESAFTPLRPRTLRITLARSFGG